MAVKSDLKHMALCLGVVCLFCSAVLALVYAVTAQPIAAAAQMAQQKAVQSVLPEGGELSEELTVEVDGRSYAYYVSKVGAQAVSYAVKSTAVGFGGPLTVMVGVLPDGTVYNTSVLSHSETPGLGAKCQSDEKFLSQFRGFGPDKVLKVTKDQGDVDAITASTITSRAYTLAVANAVAVVATLRGESVADAASGASVKAEEE